MEKNHGVSGKNESGKKWTNEKDLRDQDNHIMESKEIGRSDNLHGRIDLKDQNVEVKNDMSASISTDQVLEALERSPEVDAQGLSVTINGNRITVEGVVSDVKEGRAVVSVVENLPGVSKVINKLSFESDETSSKSAKEIRH